MGTAGPADPPAADVDAVVAVEEPAAVGVDAVTGADDPDAEAFALAVGFAVVAGFPPCASAVSEMPATRKKASVVA
jgi:hypothetical protein